VSQQTLDRRPATASAVRGVFAGSPGRMRVAGMVAVAGCLLFALLGASAYQARGDALAEANADVAQLIQVQQIAIDVVRADSLLTSAFPSPGQETAAQVADFDQALDSAAKLVADAAAAQPADVGALRQVGEALGRYRQYATSARTFNRRGDQVGFGYLRQAGAALRGVDDANPNLLPTGTTGLLPALDGLIAANRHRVDDAYTASGWATLRLVAADVAALAALAGVQVWLARRTRRYVNVPLAAATVAVLAVTVAGGVIMVGAQSRADGVRSSSYAAFTSLADARISVNAAKSDAAISFLYLRTGGSSATFRTDFDARTGAVEAALQRAGEASSGVDVGKPYAAWKAGATGLFGKVDQAWVDSAGELASQTSKINGDFSTVDGALDRGITAQVGQVDQRLGDGNLPLVVIGWLALLVGILAAVLAWGGIAQRLEDYR